MIKNYIEVVKEDVNLVVGCFKKGKLPEDKEKIALAALRIILSAALSITAIQFVASLVVGSVAGVITYIAIGILLHDTVHLLRNKSPASGIFQEVKEEVKNDGKKVKAFFFNQVPSHPLTNNMISKPFADFLINKCVKV